MCAVYAAMSMMKPKASRKRESPQVQHVPKQTRWHLYLLMDGDKTAACIYFLFVRNMMEVFGIDYLDQFEPDSFRKLMVKALNVTKDADIFGTYNFTDDDEEEKILQELGMDYQGDYTAYQMIL